MGTNFTKPKNIILSFFIPAIFFWITAVGIAQTVTGVGINTTNPRSDLEVNGSFAKKVTATTTDITLNDTHSIVVCNNASIITITLPPLSGCLGRIYTIKKGSTGNVIIDANASETISGISTYLIADVNAAVTLINDGMEWKEAGHRVALFPMGEVSYFSTTGTTVTIANRTTDGGITNMVICQPVSTFLNRGEFDNGGSNNGRIRYIGKNTKTFHVGCTISGSVDASNHTLVFGIAKNGTVQSNSKVMNIFSNNDTQSTSLHLMVTLAPNDYLDFYVGNTTAARNFVFKTYNLVAIGMPDY